MGELGGQVRADLHELLLADRLLNVMWIVGGADDVDDVDVRDVVELSGPRLSHGDHGKGHLIGPRSDGGTGHEQGRVQGGVGQSGHAAAHGGDVLDRVGAGEVIGDDRREPVPVGASQRRGRPADGSVSRLRGSLIAVRGGHIHGGGPPQHVAHRPSGASAVRRSGWATRKSPRACEAPRTASRRRLCSRGPAAGSLMTLHRSAAGVVVPPVSTPPTDAR